MGKGVGFWSWGLRRSGGGRRVLDGGAGGGCLEDGCLIGRGGFGSWIRRGLSGCFGHGGSELFRFDGIFVGLEGGGEFRNSLA